MNTTEEKTIGQLVADDYRTAQVFRNHKIDFCCKGNRTLQEVAEKKNLNLDMIYREIDEIQRRGAVENTDFKALPLDLLADYITKKHHRYVEEKIPVLKQYLNKLEKVHGARHPELLKINYLFTASSGELAMHMKKEELVLFPYIRKMVKAKQQNLALDDPHFGLVKNPIRAMMQEHDNEGERFQQIEELSNGYTPPADACNTYKVTFAILREFQDDLHFHIHLENNILFPGAFELEKELMA